MKYSSYAVVLTLLATISCSAGSQDLGENNDGGNSNEGTNGPSGAKRVFVTSATYDGNLGGLEGADAKCALAAESANLGGRWKALLSSSTVYELDRMDPVGPWFDLKGNLVYDNIRREYWDGGSSVSIPGAYSRVAIDEWGHEASQENFEYDCSDEYGCRMVWDSATTGSMVAAWAGYSNSMGTVVRTCLEWTSSTGGFGSFVTFPSLDALDYWSVRCETKLHLLCLEQ